MQFFQSFYALGYSAINLLLVTLVVFFVFYRVLGLQNRGWGFKLPYALVVVFGFVLATNFLAEQNKILNDAVRSEGGIKQNFPEN